MDYFINHRLESPVLITPKTSQYSDFHTRDSPPKAEMCPLQPGDLLFIVRDPPIKADASPLELGDPPLTGWGHPTLQAPH